MKRVMVTGCSGYIGSHLCKRLEGKYEVHGLDIVNPKAPLDKFHQIDINRIFGVEEEFDAVIHLAALVNVSESERKPISYYITNINGTMNVLNKIDTKNFIFASTGAASNCISAYGISKRAAEDVVRQYCVNGTANVIDYTTFRFYNVIGTSGYPPTNPDGLMASLIKSVETKEFTIYGNDYHTFDGTCIRDYVHVDEICNALELAIENPANQIECLGHGRGHSVKDMFDKFQKINDVWDIKLKYGPRRAGDLESSVLRNVSKYMVDLYPIDEILRLDLLTQ